MEVVITDIASIKRINIDTYVELSKVETPLNARKAMFDKYDKIRTQGIDFTDEEIQELVNEVWYEKNNN